MKKTAAAHVAVLIANLLFGINFSMVKWISPSLLSPAALNLSRVFVATGLFWLLFLIRPSSIRIPRKDIIRFLLCALTGITINQLLFIKGLTLSTPIHGSLLILATPVFILIFSLLIGTDTISWNKIGGLILAISGAVVLILARGESSIGKNILLGDFFIVVNAISYAIYFLLAKPLMSAYSPIMVIRWIFTIGTFMMLPFCWNDFINTNWSAFTPMGWTAFLFVVLGATFFAYLFTAYGLQHLSAAATGSYIYIQPIFSAGVAILFLGEEAALYKLLAAILIFTGVYLINRSSLIRRTQKETTTSISSPEA
jgi:drug/metabolite transporter (DMT)-like permease